MYTRIYFFIFISCLNTITSRIKTNDFFDFTDFSGNETCSKASTARNHPGCWMAPWHVREVFIIHVGGTRCVTSSADRNMNRQARITWTVECIRVFFDVYLMCLLWKLQGRAGSKTHLFFDPFLQVRLPCPSTPA